MPVPLPKGDILKIRAHRGGLARSMATVAEIEPTAQAVADHITSAWAWSLDGKTVSPDSVKVEKYGTGIDTRIGWDTYIVTVDGSVFGMTDGPLKA